MKSRDFKFRSFGKAGILYSSISKYSVIQEMVRVFRNGPLEQYTGLKDKNGKEIYEGDIVKDLTNYVDLWETPGLYENNKVIIPLLVAWVDSEARYMLYGDWNADEKYYQYSDQLHERTLEVIGNIYENPRLLK